MKLFEVQTSFTTYTYPVIKTILSVSVILVCIFRQKLFCIPEGTHNTMASIISVVLVLPCILVLYISIGEIFHTHSNRQYRVVDLNDTVPSAVDKVVAIAKRDDIVEIEIATKKGIVKIGSSAENTYCESVFSGKKFYIGSRDFNSADYFKSELVPLSENGLLNVLSIDGIPAKHYPF